MRFRTLAPVVALVTLLSAMPVSAATRTVDVAGSAFSPSGITVAQGTTVMWDNHDGFGHTATRSVFPTFGVTLALGDTGTHEFLQAGAFAYHCSIHGFMSGTVRVRAKASPSSGTPATSFTITVATRDADPGSSYVIQRKAPGGSFTTWKTTTARSVGFKSAKKGTWRFRAKIVKAASGKGSGYSPPVSVTIG